MSDYRTPKLEEFVQDFEFEVARDYGFAIMDLSSNESPKFEKQRLWSPMKVWWKNKPEERIREEYNGIVCDVSGSMINFFKPFDEQSFINQELVRVKIEDKLLS